MTFGERLTIIRKRKGLSQADIGKIIGINGDAYGRYERNEVKPNIDMATSISNALKVSLDYLVGKTNLELDNDTLKKIEDISKMSDLDKGHVFSLIDAFIAKTKMQGLI
ncbi:MAG: helix-turn-helix domain-containing protein [Crocinitomix sp.]|nr:helix-turn-helix domain-containing protein [Crocinitomix sp.]